jgi:predicted O-linked N-acetylglucosamine transferase (SPINDLY family)
LRDLKRHAEALESYERALRIDPDLEWLHGTWLNARMQVCDWRDFEAHRDRLVRRIERREKAANPFPVLALTGSPEIQRIAAEIWVAERHAAGHALPEMPRRPGHGKIRIGYFSADFYEHATSYLMAELLERHDKSSFQVTAFSFGPDTRDEMRGRVEAAVDRFIDVGRRSDEEVAMLARSLEIDIAVDLKGFTEDSRTDIFALRAAPIQVSYLGYPGTMGAGFIDYLVADPTIIPEGHERHYAESVAYLPNSYQVNDSRRRIAEKSFTREELGLPRDGFVFCSFNNNYKITPDVFDRWMRMLREVEGSVLWLLQDNEWAAENLRMEAGRRGIAGDRLVFARRMPLAEHLARHRLADLFVDTLPYNAHTTASDALWAGLPVLTCPGEAFAGRVGASLLNAIGLPELIARTPEEYEAAAIELANDPARLREIRQRLADNRLAAPLFDAGLFATHIEAAYTAMYGRYRDGLAPESIRVPG